MENKLLFCRLCAIQQPENVLISIADEKSISLNLVYKIVYCYNVQITTDDILPKQVCFNCCDQVLSAFAFREVVEKAQEVLVEHVLNIKEELKADTKSDITETNLVQNHQQSEPPDEVQELIDWKTGVQESWAEKDEIEDDDFEDNFGGDNYSESDSEDEKPLSKRRSKFKESFSLKEECEDDPPLETVKTSKWECLECYIVLSTPKQYSEHCKTVHKKPPEFSCNECSKKFSKYVSYTAHKRQHSSGIKCEVCMRFFKDDKYLARHMVTHSDLRPFECQECQKTFKTQGLLQSHKKKHLPLELKQKYECEECHKKFTTRTTLSMHAEIHQESAPEKKFVCDQCGRHFKQKANLNQHLTTHLEVFPYCCAKCPKAFKNVYSLRRHEKNHNEIELFHCNICMRGFRHKRALKRHGNIHTNALPYECEYCKKRFREKSYLRIHLRQHTGERPYSCIECNHHFTNDSNFIKHLKGRHALDNFSVANQRQYPFIN